MKEKRVYIEDSSSKGYSYDQFKSLIINIPNEDGTEDVMINVKPDECSIVISHYSSGQNEPYEKRVINW